MTFIKSLLGDNTNPRDKIITQTSLIGIATNLVIALIKIIAGFVAGSIAIISEGVNNASDALTSVLTLVGTKLSEKHPDKEHPFGYGRIEYLTSLIISILILITGVEVLTSSIELIFHPQPLNISIISLVIVAFSAVAKYILGSYTQNKGEQAGSSALVALGLDSKNDCFLSIVTIVSSLAYLLFHLSIDAFAGIFTSAVIIKAGLEVLKDTISDILGRAGENELAEKIYHEVRQTEGVLGAADMMLHNYGPDAYSGSVNIEIDHNRTVGEIYQIIHQLQLRIMHDYHVTMVFGIYAVDNDNPYTKELRINVAKFVREKEHVKSFHAVYIEPNSNRIYVDLIVDYDLKDWDALEKEFKTYMKEIYTDKDIELTIETEFV